jgi:hypothetical protein
MDSDRLVASYVRIQWPALYQDAGLFCEPYPTYFGWMFAACLPFGPCFTLKLTFWPSWSDLIPLA